MSRQKGYCSKFRPTPRQHEILIFIADFIEKNGIAPKLKDIGMALDMPNLGAVREHLVALEKKKFIQRKPGIPRSIVILKMPDTPKNVMNKSVPEPDMEADPENQAPEF
ncbi:MAG: hypothetical protein PHN89_03905 [Candidatus Pacebacteria bacterium]|nr:hypothetical protein [Candidatus Paceibacterota bacterium]